MSALARPRDFLRRADEAELRLCRAVSRVLSDRLSLSVFRLVSQLGDGVFWYALMGLLALTDADGRNVALRMALTGLAYNMN